MKVRPFNPVDPVSIWKVILRRRVFGGRDMENVLVVSTGNGETFAVSPIPFWRQNNFRIATALEKLEGKEE